ncbi:MAG: hypothetical protein HYW05_04045 [Candidatus Diapherotrites archaeon]|nr:hypothetical protein [Candidatus Diapherotrites archaeon]
MKKVPVFRGKPERYPRPLRKGEEINLKSDLMRFTDFKINIDLNKLNYEELEMLKPIVDDIKRGNKMDKKRLNLYDTLMKKLTRET